MDILLTPRNKRMINMTLLKLCKFGMHRWNIGKAQVPEEYNLTCIDCGIERNKISLNLIERISAKSERQ